MKHYENGNKKKISQLVFQFCQNGTFEPVHEIQNFFWPKAFF